MLLTQEEWAKLSPESRHQLNMFVKRVEEFVGAVYGGDERKTKATIDEMYGIGLDEAHEKPWRQVG